MMFFIINLDTRKIHGWAVDIPGAVAELERLYNAPENDSFKHLLIIVNEKKLAE